MIGSKLLGLYELISCSGLFSFECVVFFCSIDYNKVLLTDTIPIRKRHTKRGIQLSLAMNSAIKVSIEFSRPLQKTDIQGPTYSAMGPPGIELIVWP